MSCSTLHNRCHCNFLVFLDSLSSCPSKVKPNPMVGKYQSDTDRFIRNPNPIVDWKLPTTKKLSDAFSNEVLKSFPTFKGDIKYCHRGVLKPTASTRASTKTVIRNEPVLKKLLMILGRSRTARTEGQGTPLKGFPHLLHPPTFP